jgi:hypothetical protein
MRINKHADIHTQQFYASATVVPSREVMRMNKHADTHTQHLYANDIIFLQWLNKTTQMLTV